MYAYPYQHRHPTTGVTTMSEGMTLRDYIAIHAMQGYCSDYQYKVENGQEETAIASYKMADAMLKAREVKHD
jgi:hypothetical protein